MNDSAPDSRAALDRAVGALNLPPGAQIVVAVSGGADSVALLLALSRVASARQWGLLVAHVEHGLRGEASLLDAAFVRDLAERLGLPYEESSVDVLRVARDHGLSEEAAARDLRYRELDDMLRRWHGDVIATGHTLNDQAETFLLHLLRGAGLAGLAGMRSRSGSIVRPLLGVDRETVLRALQEDRQGYRVDSTNEDERHMRVRVRRRTLPALKDVQPRVEDVLARAARLVADDAALLADEARQTLELAALRRDACEIVLSRAAVGAMHPALRRALLREAVLAVRGSLIDVTERQIVSLAAHTCGNRSAPLELPAGLHVESSPDMVRIATGKTVALEAPRDVELVVPGTISWAGGNLKVTVEPRPDDDALDRLLAVIGPCHALLDAERLEGSPIVGSRRPGDRIRKLGASGSSTLKKLFIDTGVPRFERALTPIVRDAAGPLWVVGVAIDERVAITAKTRRIAHLCYRPAIRPAC
jgi:tRNA(Ile)-lysidine synthase